MDETEHHDPTPQLCTISIGFAVTNDDDALAVKKKIVEAVGNMPEVNIQFALRTMPQRPR